MRVFITGIDGYLGWSLAVYLGSRGHTVAGLDNLARRSWVRSVDSDSAIPIAGVQKRKAAYKTLTGQDLEFHVGTLLDYPLVSKLYRQFKPDAIVYLGQMPSAPYSMKGVEEAIYTQHDNILGNLTTLWAMKEVCPDAHLLKLGTMGEYGTPDCEIPEGKFPSGASWFNQNTEHVGNLGGMTFPRQAGSWYHQSKVHDTHNVEMACRIWGLRSTDVMQGIVYGTHIDEMEEDPDLRTRFDFDECFGTVIHRFCSQAVAELSLTVYGSGKQIRGFLPLKDSIHCLELALENPPEFGEYRVFNQLAYSQSIARVAIQVRDAALSVGIQATIGQTGNPRVESETHKYAVSCNNLKYLGYTPSYDLPTDLQAMMTKLKPYKSRILAYRSAIDPKTTWK